VNKDLIKAVRNSYSFYKEELAIAKAATERMEKQREEQNNVDEMCKQLLQQEEELLVKHKDLQRQQQEANLIIADASARLQVAVKKKKVSILIEQQF